MPPLMRCIFVMQHLIPFERGLNESSIFHNLPVIYCRKRRIYGRVFAETINRTLQWRKKEGSIAILGCELTGCWLCSFQRNKTMSILLFCVACRFPFPYMFLKKKHKYLSVYSDILLSILTSIFYEAISANMEVALTAYELGHGYWNIIAIHINIYRHIFSLIIYTNARHVRIHIICK